MEWYRKHQKAGTRVILTRGMGVLEKGVNHREGVIESRDGGYYLIKMDFDPKCVCERYLCEIEGVYINGEWLWR